MASCASTSMVKMVASGFPAATASRLALSFSQGSQSDFWNARTTFPVALLSSADSCSSDSILMVGMVSGYRVEQSQVLLRRGGLVMFRVSAAGRCAAVAPTPVADFPGLPGGVLVAAAQLLALGAAVDTDPGENALEAHRRNSQSSSCSWPYE